MQKYLLSALLITAASIGTFFFIKRKANGGTMSEQKNSLITRDSGLQYLVLTEPKADARQAQPGNRATVHYSGWLFDESAPEFKGKKFDSSVDRGEPLKFNVGVGMVIAGWDEGLSLMKVGEKRRFIIPAKLAYGDRGVGAIIPPNATLVFDVELLELD